MIYTNGDIKKANRDKSKYRDIKVENGTLILDESTKDIQFISMTDKKDIKKVIIKSIQPNLKYLDLSRCNIGEVEFSADCCPVLESLYLLKNKMVSISFNTTFPKLQLLDLSYNKNLSTIEVSNVDNQMPKLKYLYLHACNLHSLEAFTSFFIKSNNDFNIGKNEDLAKPPEAIISQGKYAIKAYFEELLAGEKEEYLYEAKLLILGDPRAGKTSLARKIVKADAKLPEKDETTKGIELGEWKFKYNFEGRGEKEVIINIWDFGGQTIYKQAHRFFLTERSIYILLSDAGSSETTDFPYWLHITKIFGGKSPVIIVINEKDKRKYHVPFETLQNINNFLKDNISLDLSGTVSHDKERYLEMKNILKTNIVSLKHLGEPVPSSWKNIREWIASKEEEGVKVIESKEYYDTCDRFGVKEKRRKNSLAQYFNDIGVFQFYHDDELLKRYIFINKKYILDAAYLLLDSSEVIDKKGKLTVKEFNSLYDDNYERLLPEIKALLKKFHLIYEKDRFIVVPQKLPEEKQVEWKTNDSISFVFSYEQYMPAGILWQLIVDMNGKIKDDIVWRYGVVLVFEDETEVLVVEEYGEDKINISVKGVDNSGKRAIVVNKIEEINSLYADLSVEKLVPCICDECIKLKKENKRPYFHDFNRLNNLKNKGKNFDICGKSAKNVSIKKLLEGIGNIKHVIPEKKGGIDKMLLWRYILMSILGLIVIFALYTYFVPYKHIWLWWGAIGAILIGYATVLDRGLNIRKKIIEISKDK